MNLYKPGFLNTILISSIWAMPILLVSLESLLFFRSSTWESSSLIYYIALWLIRFALTPLIILYTFKFWAEPNKIIKIGLMHIIGFILFTLAHSSAAYFLLKGLIVDHKLFGVSQSVDNSRLYFVVTDNTVSVNVVVYISTVMVCYIQEYVRRTLFAQQKSLELEKMLAVSRLELLKGQLNTHFLFNVLHTISSLVVRRQVNEANTMLIKLSDLLRFSLKENKEPLITLKKELEILQLYLDIQKARFKERLDLHINVPEELEFALVPPLMLQPIVENAVKYGVEQFPVNGIIEINVVKRGNKLRVSVTDNGETAFKDINFDNGIGLSNTRERLQKLYDNACSFTINPNYPQNGVCILIEIPLQYHNDRIPENTYS